MVNFLILLTLTVTLACTWAVLWCGAWLLGNVYELLTGEDNAN